MNFENQDIAIQHLCSKNYPRVFAKLPLRFMLTLIYDSGNPPNISTDKDYTSAFILHFRKVFI